MKTTGFASPATEYETQRISFDHLLRRHPSSTFEFRYQGTDLLEYGIFENDILIIDRAAPIKDGCMAIISSDGSFICRKLLYSSKWKCFVYKEGSRWFRVAEAFGTVTYCIHSLTPHDIPR